MTREMGATMAAVIAPIDFLVLPRILALGLMMPAMCLYADLLGLRGGTVVGATMLELGVIEYSAASSS
jgi:phospholipid/cholesterol/gamma-HCH transport system permease protein